MNFLEEYAEKCMNAASVPLNAGVDVGSARVLVEAITGLSVSIRDSSSDL